MDRVWLPPLARDGARFLVTGGERRHLDVLRVRAGDRFLATDGEGSEFLLEVERCTRAEVEARIVEERTPPGGPGDRVTLAFAPPKGTRTEVAIEKAVECGVGRIVPVVTERSIVKARGDTERLARWRRIAASATAQSGRCRLPEIAPFTDLAACLEEAGPGGGRILLAHPGPHARPVADALAGGAPAAPVTILVGPEGGFTDAEADLGRRAGAIAVSLGPHRLRTETAAVVAVALVVASLERGAREA
jgi:16S rRNA (uracil1498-N3)-methyltransferase